VYCGIAEKKFCLFSRHQQWDARRGEPGEEIYHSYVVATFTEILYPLLHVFAIPIIKLLFFCFCSKPYSWAMAGVGQLLRSQFPWALTWYALRCTSFSQ